MTCAWTRAGPFPLAGVGERPAECVVRLEEVAAVGLGDEEAGEGADELRDRAARRVHLDRHRDGVAVVLDDEDHGELLPAGGAERLPELPLGRRPVADRHDDDLVVGRHRGRRPEVRGLGAEEVPPRLRRADARKALRPRGRGGGEDVQLLRAPVRRHLPPGRGRVVGRADALQEHLERRDAEAEAERPVAVVAEEPVTPRRHVEGDRGLGRLVPGPGDLEEDPVLPLELDLLVVDPPRRVDVPVRLDEVVLREAEELLRRLGGFRRHRRRRLPEAPARPRDEKGEPGAGFPLEAHCGKFFPSSSCLTSPSRFFLLSGSGASAAASFAYSRAFLRFPSYA